MLVTSILGPVMTERFARDMLEGAERDTQQTSAPRPGSIARMT
jgi:hypothetical protein